ncbi:MAG: VWA domain-containing protein [Planctomycetota bacterium]
MNFAAPLLLGLGALAAPIVVLYILKVRRRDVRVPYLRLWEQLVVDTKARSLFKRLKRLYSLLLQLLILASLVLAIAQPDFDLKSNEKESIVLLLDCSASMLTVEDGAEGAPDRARFELMLERAREFVEGRSREDEMLIAAVSDRVDVLVPFNRSKLRLREALARVVPTKRALDVAAGLAFAREVTADRAAPVVLFLSDGNAGTVPKALEGQTNASFVPIGATRENAAILRFTARKNESLGTDYLLAVLKNFGAEALETRLELSRDGNVIAVEPIQLPPGEEVSWSKKLTLDEGGTLRLALDHKDAFSVDDEAFAVVRPVRLRKIGLVVAEEDQAAPFLVAFQAMIELVSEASFFTTVAQYATMTELRREADITICVGVVPEGLPARGNLILMDTPIPDFLPATESGRDPKPTVWDWDREHLLNRYLNYRDLPIPPARIVQLEGGEALVTGYDGPLISAFDLTERRVVHIGFDMTAELFPFRLAFPMLLRNAIAWFEAEEDVLFEPTYAPGATISPLRRITDAAPTVTFLRDDAPVEVALAPQEGRFYFADTEQPGAYVFRIDERNYPAAVNLFDPLESDLAPSEATGDALAGTAHRSLFNRDLWALLAALGLALWALEWVTFHRRITE